MARIFVDTSAIYALLDRSDRNHRAAATILEALTVRRAQPLVTNFVVAETHGLLVARLGPDIARRWLFGNVWAVERVMVKDEDHAREILRGYEDKRFSYTDATSFAVMERLRLTEAFSFDRHFAQYGFQLLAA
ncbi:MAG TPA: PIN domain-containing protein [Candidatus Binatia bacterium]|nr:PIN domain-containing protein [Candidatus Binatia bacterium]